MTDGPRYRVEERLGHGTSGAVERATLLEPFEEWPAGTQVAVKTLHVELRHDPDVRGTLAREAEVARSVSDPGLVRVLHHGEGPSGPALVMEFVPGRSLRERLESGPLPEPLVRSTGARVAGALAVLHAVGRVHGDVKPENVRLDEEGHAVLVDLGFAARQDEVAGGGPGSLLYLAPERLSGGPPTPASDVFALGVLLYELATGTHPFDPDLGARLVSGRLPLSAQSSRTSSRTVPVDTDGERWVASLQRARTLPASRLAPRTSPFLDDALAAALEADPARRPTASELARLLEEGESSRTWRSRPSSARRRRAAHARLTRLVGRDRELARLREVYLAAGDLPGRVVWIEGESGSGKSRLVDELAEGLRDGASPPLLLYARCTELSESRPTGVGLDLVRRYFVLPRGVPPAAADVAEIEATLPPDTARSLVLSLTPGEADRAPRPVPEAVGAWLLATARRTPTVVFLDDVHLSGPATRQILGELARGLEDARLLLLVGSRPDEGGGGTAPMHEFLREGARRSGTELVEMRLEHLARPDVEELVADLFHPSAPRLRLARKLWEHTRGNPGLLAEALRGLVASGEAAPAALSPDRLVLTVRPESLRLPDTVARGIARRLETLSERDRTWLERMAAMGGRLASPVLAAAYEAPEGEVDEALAELVRTGWLVPVADRYRFARPALREVVERGLSSERRARFHLAAARALRPEPGAAVAVEDAFQRGFHLHAAGADEELLEHLPILLESAERTGSPQRQHLAARWGLEALERLPATEERDELQLELLERAADAADRLGLRDAERGLLDELARRYSDPDRYPQEGARVYLLHGRLAVATGRYGFARGTFANAAELARRAGDRSLESEALRRLAQTQLQVGELEEARRVAARARRAAQDEHARALARLASAEVDLLTDRLESALREVDRALRALRREGASSAGARAVAHLLRGRAWRSAGRPGRALGAVQRALRLARAAGERRLEAQAIARLGGLYLDLDRPGTAEDLLRESLLVAEEIEDARGRVLSQVWLGILLWEQDRAEALGAVERAVQLSRELGFARAEAVALSVRARIERREGQHAAALASSARAMDLVDERGAELLDRIVIAGTRAFALEGAGRSSEAARVQVELERAVRRANRRLRDRAIARDQRAYCEGLLALVLSPEGPIYPRAGGAPAR